MNTPEVGRAVDAALMAAGELAKAAAVVLAIPDPFVAHDRLRRALAEYNAAVLRLHEATK